MVKGVIKLKDHVTCTILHHSVHSESYYINKQSYILTYIHYLHMLTDIICTYMYSHMFIYSY